MKNIDMKKKQNKETFDFYQKDILKGMNKDSKIVLVTGGAGFIGSNFIKFLLKKYPKYKIINFDKLTYAGNLNNLTMIENNPNYFFIKGDVAAHKDVKTVFEEFNPDYVVHFAAESHVDRSIINPDVFLQTNIIGTQIMLNYARDHNITKFIQVSTDEVYGSLEKKGSFDERSPLAPNNPYAASKASSDLLLRVAHQTYGQRINIVRTCNNYGANQFPEKFIPLIINNAFQDKEIPVYGDGKYFRNWINVEDNCRAVDLILHQGKTGETYNVSDNNEWENLDLVEYILGKMKKPKSLIRFVLDRPGHDYRYALNFSKIKNELGWKPRENFDEGLDRTIEWFKNNSDWVQEVSSGQYMNYFSKYYKK